MLLLTEIQIREHKVSVKTWSNEKLVKEIENLETLSEMQEMTDSMLIDMVNQLEQIYVEECIERLKRS